MWKFTGKRSAVGPKAVFVGTWSWKIRTGSTCTLQWKNHEKHVKKSGEKDEEDKDDSDGDWDTNSIQ